MADEGDRAEAMATLFAPDTGSLRAGERFADRYRIGELVGRGGMGAVYRVFDEAVGDTVALKTLSTPQGCTEAVVERFRREVRLARRVTHPNVARIHDLGEHRGIHFLTMEYVDGRDLGSVGETEGRLAPAQAAALLHPVAEALAAAHGAGVVHRDLKPANILLERTGRVVLTDFGIARGLAGEATALHTNGPIGTPQYMAPEQLAGEPVDGRTDLYALGLVLYELLTGQHAFSGPTPIAIAFARLKQPAPDPRASVTLPDELADLVVRCLARAKDDRPGTAAEVAEVLARFRGDTPAPSIDAPRALAAASASKVIPLAQAPTGSASTLGTVSPGDRTLAVLPFRFRGPSDLDYLGEALSDDLIDVLTRTRGLRVLASGATHRFVDERDPRTIGSALGADVLVDGTVQASADRVRVTARLSESHSGTQLWSERFEGTLGDVWQWQETMSQRIAEALRVGLTTELHRGQAPPGAIDAYLRGRRALRITGVGLNALTDAIQLLEECLAAAPDFQPAMAAHARACLMAWFIPGFDQRDWEAVARESVARACARAPDLAETHLVAGMLHVQDGHLEEAARSLGQALEIAPTCADAHDYLGRLEVEAGRAKQGVRRLRLAMELDPELHLGLMDVARNYALEGDMETAKKTVAELRAAGRDDHPAIFSTRMRLAAWCGDEAEIRAALEQADSGRSPAYAMLQVYGRVVLREMPLEEGISLGETSLASLTNGRFRSVMLQLMAEACAAVGADDEALGYVKRAADALLVDVEWIERCPLLAAIRHRPELAAALRIVQARAEAIWAA